MNDIRNAAEVMKSRNKSRVSSGGYNNAPEPEPGSYALNMTAANIAFVARFYEGMTEHTIQ